VWAQAKKSTGPGRKAEASTEVRRLREEVAALRQQLKLDQGGDGLTQEVQRLIAEVKDAHQQLAQVGRLRARSPRGHASRVGTRRGELGKGKEESQGTRGKYSRKQEGNNPEDTRKAV
jgi:hypothetical protein